MTWQSPVVSIPTMNVIPLVHISPTFVHFVFFTFHVSGPNLFFSVVHFRRHRCHCAIPFRHCAGLLSSVIFLFCFVLHIVWFEWFEAFWVLSWFILDG